MQRDIRRTSSLLAFVVALTRVSFAGTGGVGEGISTSHSGVQSCQAINSTDFTRLEDAPTQILEATVVEATASTPSYCRVRGYVAPQVNFEMRLPTANWNGKLLEIGGGGWGGEMYLFFCSGPLRKGYACIASDMGHTGTSGLALWARNNLQAKVDFGYRATHVTALIGKAVAQVYYGKPPAKSMMFGCSTGGYQGMVEAQRFPWDFNGIVAIAPDMGSEADLSMRIVWKLRNLSDKDGKPIFRTSDLVLLHEAALRACDLSDGIKDGIIGDPVACEFDPAVLTCAAGKQSECLNPEQVQAAKNIYGGPTTSKGMRISTRGVFPGSELDWADNNESSSAGVADFFKFALFEPSPGPDWKIRDFDFDHDYQRLGIGAFYTDNNPDLRNFKAAGGKLILAQGGNDVSEIPGAVFDYYDMVKRTMGGAASTEDFMRLFVVPGMKHCTGGDGAFAVDYLTYLEDWVEKDHAPDVMIGAHVDAGYLLQRAEEYGSPDKDRIWLAALKLSFPLDSDIPVTFTRPIYPYPRYAKYKGTGDPNDAANFGPTDSSEIPHGGHP